MSSIPVNNNLNVLANIVNQMPGVSDSRALSDRQEELISDSFDMVMNRVSSQADTRMDAQAQTAVSSVTASAKTVSAGVTVSGSSKQNETENSAAQTAKKPEKTTDDTVSKAEDNASGKTDAEKDVSGKDVSDKGISEEEKAAVTETGEKLVEEVAKELDIAPEEVLEAMEILGLSAVQLLDPENMKQLLVTLSGNDDQLSILTDGELYSHLQNLMDMVSMELEELKTELGLSDEELNAVIADMAVLEKKSEQADVPEELLTQSDKEPEVNLEGMKDYSVTVHKNGETVEVKVKVDDVSGEQSSKEEVKAAPETQNRAENKQEEKNLFGGSRDESRGEANTAGNFVMQNPIEQPNFNEIPQQPVMERYVSTEDIMNQIMESMKINLKEDVQELEMHLHPASLGNVHVQIAAREGMITAQFIAQNEVVKAAIESQLVQLKEQFEEQGIKVDEVEVAVGDYRYDHSFAGDEKNTQENEKQGKKTRRNINLNELDLDELPEDMEDSERIAAEMMAQSGNTVDYTA